MTIIRRINGKISIESDDFNSFVYHDIIYDENHITKHTFELKCAGVLGPTISVFTYSKVSDRLPWLVDA